MHRKLINKKYKVAGSTLTEVIVASALLVVAIVPILKALTAAHLSSTIIEYKTKSLTLAQARLNRINVESIYNYSSSFAESNNAIEGSYLCNVLDTSAGSNLRQIAVAVGYDKSGNGILSTDETEITLTTYLAKRW